MEIKNNEGKLIGVQLQENWKVWPQKRAIVFVTFSLVFFITVLGFVFYIISQLNLKSGLIVLAIAIGVFLLVNTATILKALKPAKYNVMTENGILTITCNGKEKLSITPQYTNRIIIYRHDNDLEGIGIYEVEPNALSDGVGYKLDLSYIPNDEIRELLRLLELFYGRDRLLPS